MDKPKDIPEPLNVTLYEEYIKILPEPLKPISLFGLDEYNLALKINEIIAYLKEKNNG